MCICDVRVIVNMVDGNLVDFLKLLVVFEKKDVWYLWL